MVALTVFVDKATQLQKFDDENNNSWHSRSHTKNEEKKKQQLSAQRKGNGPVLDKDSKREQHKLADGV